MYDYRIFSPVKQRTVAPWEKDPVRPILSGLPRYEKQLPYNAGEFIQRVPFHKDETDTRNIEIFPVILISQDNNLLTVLPALVRSGKMLYQTLCKIVYAYTFSFAFNQFKAVNHQPHNCTFLFYLPLCFIKNRQPCHQYSSFISPSADGSPPARNFCLLQCSMSLQYAPVKKRA